MNYEIFKQRGQDGGLGKTAKFWIIYLGLMKYQHMALTAVQQNELEITIYGWESMIPFYFWKINFLTMPEHLLIRVETN